MEISHQSENISAEMKTDKLTELLDFLDRHGYFSTLTDGGRVKHKFSQLGKKAFSELAKLLKLKPSKVKFFHDLPSTSGTVQLKGMVNDWTGVKISLSSGKSYGSKALVYTISDMEEASRGESQVFERALLRNPDDIKAFVDKLVDQERNSNTTKMNLKKLESFADFLAQYETINGYKEDGKVKRKFGRLGKQAFKELAEYLGMKEYHVDFNKAGNAVSGDLTLMGMFITEKGIYIHYDRDFFPAQVLYRTIEHMKDFTGGSNHFFTDDEFRNPQRIKAKVLQLVAPLSASKANDDAPKEYGYDNPKLKPNHFYDLHFKVWNSTKEEITQALNKNGIEYSWASDKVGFYYLSYQEAIRVTEISDKNGSILFLDKEYPPLNPLSDDYPGISKVEAAALSGGSWFKKHPKKVLGEVYQTKDRFGKQVDRVKGSIEHVIQGIDIPSTELPQQTEQALTTEIKPTIKEQSLNEIQRSNLDRVIEQTKESHSQEALKKVSCEIGESSDNCPDGYYSFEDILDQYNKGISEDEIKAWVWYKRVSGGYRDESVILNPENGWSKYVIPLANQDSYLEGWVEEGIVCYNGSTHIPSVIYYAENIYHKQAELLKAKEEAIAKYGEDQFKRQWESLEHIKPLKLTLADPVIENRLVLNPKSSFVKETTVLQLNDGTVFRKENETTKKFEDRPKPILEVFKTWLKDLPTTAFKISNATYIINYYLSNQNVTGNFDKDEKKRIKRNAKLEGSELFGRFLAEVISREDQLKIEQLWNSIYNGYVEINYFKIPVAFTCSKTFKNKPLFLRDAQREGIGFIGVHGVGCVAFDVGVGKTMTAILSLAQLMESGECKRPLIVVPNQTYANWLSELRGRIKNGEVLLTGVLPQYRVNDLYNLGSSYVEQLTDNEGQVEPVDEQTITVVTYEGFNQLGFGKEAWDMIGQELYEILNQGHETEREREKLYERIEEFMGRGLKGGMVNIEDLGFDAIVFDEVHNMKKSFTRVRGQITPAGTRGKVPYHIQSGEPSMRALRAFMVSQYILRHNNMRNVIGLSATPFTNSPLEIYSMLALFAYQQLERNGIKNIKDFFDQFVKTSVELTVNAKLQPERREVILSFNNLVALQQVIFRFINYKTADEVNVERPNKIVLPLVNQQVGDELVPLPPDQQISTNLPMTEDQKDNMHQVELYVKGLIDLMSLCVNESGFEDVEDEPSGEVIQSLSEQEEDNARVLRALSLASQLALSPYLYACNKNKAPDAKTFVEESPKIYCTMLCIQSVKEYCGRNDLEMPGQIIYSNAGVDYFPLIKEYLIQYVGFDESEIGIIRSGLTASKKNTIKDRFNEGVIKILIGSATIREGMNLQYRSTDLYVLWLDWNSIDLHQLIGRICRPGNRYANVRVMIPLMENSIDIFRFQKHEEKTSRINEVWHRSNRANTMKLEEVNPAELKWGLITDPYALAELMVAEEKENLRDGINSLSNQKEVLEAIHKARETFNRNIEHVKAKVELYKPRKEGQKPRQLETIFRIYKQWLEDPETETHYNDEQVLSDARRANYRIQSGIRDVLAPRGLDISFDYDREVQRIEKELEAMEEELTSKAGKEAIDAHAQKIIEQRKQQQYRSATVEQRVEEFAKLNARVLSEMVITDVPFETVADKADPKPKKSKLTKEQEHILITRKAMEMRLRVIEIEMQMAA